MIKENAPSNWNGHRIELDGHRGTVRFRGPLPTLAGPPNNSDGPIWLGIEWDEPQRGKHSGTIQDPYTQQSKSVFTVRIPNSATFVKQSNSKLVSSPTPFLDALIDKYLPHGANSLHDSAFNESEQSTPKYHDMPEHSRGELNGMDVPGRDAKPTLTESFGRGPPKLAKKTPTAATSGTLRLGDNAVVVQVVGWEKVSRKQANLKVLREVGLAGCRVGGTVFSSLQSLSIADKFPAIVDLDLSKNLFGSLAEVALICRRLPCLEILRLNHNRFENVISDVTSGMLDGAFERVRTLAINSTLVDWQEALAIGRSFPALEELHMGFNGIRALRKSLGPDPSDERGLSGLILLNLESNLLSSWDEVICACQNLPKLKVLHLSSNSIKIIRPLTADIASMGLQSLTCLHLSDNCITDWSSVHALNSYPSLTDLRIKGNPFISLVGVTAAAAIAHQNSDILRAKGFSADMKLRNSLAMPSTAKVLEEPIGRSTATLEAERSNDIPRLSSTNTFFELIARCGKLDVVNGSRVNSRDRRDAELWYMNRCASERAQLVQADQGSTGDGGSLLSFEAYHPRFAELVKIHGDPEVAPSRLTSASLKDRVIEVRMVCVYSSTAAKAPLLENGEKLRKLPISMEVRAVRALMMRLFGIRPSGQRVCKLVAALPLRADHRDADGNSSGRFPGVEMVNLDEERREIGHYNIQNGDEIRLWASTFAFPTKLQQDFINQASPSLQDH